MEVSDHLHAPAPLTPVATEQEAGRAAEQIQTL
jgi:hypothetical protein